MKRNIANEQEVLDRIFEKQKQNYSPSSIPTYEVRMDRLNRLEKMVRIHMEDMTKALQEDFGTRSSDWIFVAEFYPVLDHLTHVKKSLKQWMKKERKSTGIMALIGQREYIINEPLGVVGVMAPFNAPVSLALDPAIEAIAAGNSVIAKISENTPHIADLMKKIAAETFQEHELAFVTGGMEVSKHFSALPWDKLFFTGGSEVGKKILGGAAKNLTPAILELGGKSPCVILDDADVKEAAEKIGQVRVLNAGQVCIAGDYVLLMENQLETFVETVVESVGNKYPTIVDNEDYTSICYQQAYDRIVSYMDEAREANCRIVQVNPSNEELPDPESRKIPLTLVINPPKDMMVSRHEIFGPILTVFTYDKLEEAVEEINSREKALALYIFGKNRKSIDYIVNNTSSGGITVNDLLMQANARDMGFGGVGYSGMGRYKGGFIGYQAFTNPKTVVEQGLMRKFSSMFTPPYSNKRYRKMIRSQVGVK